MTPEKAARILQGQTALARKAFDAVPYQEWWDIWQVKRELERIGSVGVINHTQLRGCLKCLCDAGLIDEQQERFRSAVTLAVKAKPEPKGIPMSKALAVPIPVAKPTSALDRMAALSAEQIELADEVRQKMNRLCRIATELDDIALEIAAERATSDKKFEKLNKVQTLMRELSREAVE